MPYDRRLAERIRTAVADEPAVVEKEMVDPDETDALVALSGVALFEMGGRSMRGWLSVDEEQLTTPATLASWVERGISFARSLPTKA